MSWRRRLLETLLLIAILGVAGLILLAACWKTAWVGRTDLLIVFAVSDAGGGEPVEGATVDIRQEAGGFCGDRTEKMFALTAGADGGAEHLCQNCMCGGIKSLFTESFGIHTPQWWFRVSAPGYTSTEWVFLEDVPEARQVQRLEGFARMVVKVSLRKAVD
jgi:hypothetical protein